MLKSNYKNNLIINSLIDLGADIAIEGKGKGRKFVSRFIEPGVAHYEDFGDVLITKETLDKFVQTMVGCPVIIKHKDIDDKNVDKERVGVVSKVWYNEADGWFYCEGIIWDKQAIDLVKNQGWNVSCTYDFDSDKQPKMHNGKKIDMEFTGGEFLHLALVPNPRYERANIVMNSKAENEDKWITIHPNGEDNKGRHLLVKDGETPKEAVERAFGKKEDKKDITKRREIEHNGAKISIIPDGKYSDIKIDAPEGKTFKNGDTWYRTQAETEKAEEHAKRIIEGEFGQSKQEELYDNLLKDSALVEHLRESVKARKADDPDAKVGDTIIDSDRFISRYTDKLTTEQYKKFDWDKAEELVFDKLKEFEREAGFQDKTSSKQEKEQPKEEDTYKSRFSDIQNIVGTIKKGEQFFDSKIRTAKKRLQDKLEAWEKDLKESNDHSAIKQAKERNIEIVKDEIEKLKRLTSENAIDNIVNNALTEVIVENCLGEF